MSEDIIDTAVGAIMIAIALVVSAQIIFPDLGTSLMSGALEIFVKITVWIVLIAVLVGAIRDFIER